MMVHAGKPKTEKMKAGGQPRLREILSQKRNLVGGQPGLHELLSQKRKLYF